MDTFPHTSEQNYITGRAALNIPNEDLSFADWHFDEMFLSGKRTPRVAGIDTESTFDLLGNYGIRECGGMLRRCGVPLPIGATAYAASHYRAILDMVIFSIRKNRLPEHVSVHDMLDTPEQITELQTQVDVLKLKLTDPIALSLLNQWEEKYIHIDPYA